MSAGARLAAFAALLAAVLVAAVGVGRAVGPVDAEPTEAEHGTQHEAEHGTEHAGEGDAAALPGGVTSTLDDAVALVEFVRGYVAELDARKEKERGEKLVEK